LDAQGQACAAMAEGELRRVTHLTQQSLSFYRESAFPTLVNIEEMIDGVLTIYDKRVNAKGIRVTRRYQLDGVTIKTQPGEIRQIFSTLLLNAMEAIEAGIRSEVSGLPFPIPGWAFLQPTFLGSLNHSLPARERMEPGWDSGWRAEL